MPRGPLRPSRPAKSILGYASYASLPILIENVADRSHSIRIGNSSDASPPETGSEGIFEGIADDTDALKGYRNRPAWG